MPVKPKILIVEDSDNCVHLYETVLGGLKGYELIVLRSPEAAVETARAMRPDCAIIDIALKSVLSGLDVIRQLKGDADLQAMPILCVSAFAQPEDREAVRQAAPEAYLSKPYSPKVLMDAVDALLAQRQTS